MVYIIILIGLFLKEGKWLWGWSFYYYVVCFLMKIDLIGGRCKLGRIVIGLLLMNCVMFCLWKLIKFIGSGYMFIIIVLLLRKFVFIVGSDWMVFGRVFGWVIILLLICWKFFCSGKVGSWKYRMLIYNWIMWL